MILKSPSGRRLGWLRLRQVGLLAVEALCLCAAAPNAQCNHASNSIEQTICNDRALANLDDKLTDLYKREAAHSQDLPALRKEEQGWLRFRDTSCGVDPLIGLGIGAVLPDPHWRTECLSQIYTQRLDNLQSTAQDGAGSSSASGNLCHLLVASIPPPGSLVQGDVTDIISQSNSKTMTINPPKKDGLSIETLDPNGWNCPAIKVSFFSGHSHMPVSLPAGSDDYCGEIPFDDWPDFSIANVSGQQVILRRFPVVLDVTPRIRSAWGPTCSIHMLLRPVYSIDQFYCSGEYCASLAKIGPRLADLVSKKDRPSPTPGLVALWNASVPPPDRELWANMKQNAFETLRTVSFSASDPQNTMSYEYFDNQNGTTRFEYRGVVAPGEDTAFVPIILDGKVLLGKIGSYGYGCCHATDIELLSVFNLEKRRLVPIAGMILVPSGSRLMYASTN